jgi:hypothetical protein
VSGCFSSLNDIAHCPRIEVPTSQLIRQQSSDAGVVTAPGLVSVIEAIPSSSNL